MFAAFRLSFKEIQETGRSYNEPNRTRKKSNQLEAPDRAPPIRFMALFLAEVCVRKVL